MNRLAPAFLDRREAPRFRKAILDWLLAPRIAILAAFVLSLPAIRTGIVADDIWHRSMLLHDGTAPMMHGGPLALFTFVSGDAADHRLALESGMLPWWMPPGFRMSFFRPVASLTHALDYALWPDSPAAMHLHSILWYVLGVALAGVLYRRWLGRISPKAAAIATLFYAVDPTHGLPVGWIANRNALIATVFAFGTLLIHDAGVEASGQGARSPRARFFPWLAALTLGLALGSGESATATVVYLGLHALLLDRRPVSARVRSLVPAGVVTLAWAAVYRLGHFGVVGSGIYHDPLRAPVAFLRGIVTNGPLLIASELGVSPDPWPALPTAAKVMVLATALALIAWGARILKRALVAENEDLRRLARFFVAAGCLSVIPSTAAFPSGRLLLLPGFALVGLLAMVCAGVVPGPASRGTRAFAKWVWVMHVVAAPALFLLSLHFAAIVQAAGAPLALGIPHDGGAAHKRLVVVNAPDSIVTGFLLADMAQKKGSAPERALALTGNLRDVRVDRVDERTLRVHEDGGFTRTGTELLFVDNEKPMPVGARIELSDVVITVTHATADGVPDEASFEFTQAFDDAYVFRKWEGMSLVSFALPPVGTSVRFESRMPKL